MSVQVRTELKKEYLHIFLEGEYDQKEAMLGLQKMIEECVRTQASKVLVDVRSLGGDMPTMDRFNVAEAFTQKYFEAKNAGKISHIRFAYLGNYPMIDPSRFGETVAVNRGLTLKATTDLKEALDWLLVGSN